jgi:hypothetical protein
MNPGTSDCDNGGGSPQRQSQCGICSSHQPALCLQHLGYQTSYEDMTEQKNARPISQLRLFQIMSEVISLRERVAQAELAATKFSPSPEPRDKVAGSNQRALRRSFS